MEPGLPARGLPGRGQVAIVIGSGGAKCAAALGLWKVFQREGIQACMAVGSSGGSIYAASMALGIPIEAAERMTLEFWTSDLMEGYAAHLRAVMSGETRFTEESGLIDDQPLLDRLENAFGERTFADTLIPLHIVATDLHTGESVVLSSGRILDAVRASIAIPMIFSPWRIGEQWLVDGAVSDPLPVDVAIKEDAEVIVAMGFELPIRSRLNSYTAMTAHFNSLYMNNILKASFAFHNLAHHAEVIPVMPEIEKSIGSFDGSQIPVVIEAGARATEEHVLYLLRLMEAKDKETR